MTPPPTMTTPPTEEYKRNRALDYINPRYAYEQKHSGKGVTIAIIESAAGENCFLTTHEDLAENILTMTLIYEQPTALIRRFECKDDYHATQVAGVAAASRNDKGAHGVAPEAKILPLILHANYEITINRHINITTETNYGFKEAYNRGIKIMNFSLGGLNTVSMPNGLDLSAALNHANVTVDALGDFSAIEDEDVVMVWGAGNGGFNGVRRTDARIQSAHAGYYPLVNPKLKDNMLVAVGVVPDDNDSYRIANRSNGCGDAEEWCLSAPWAHFAVPSGPANNRYTADGGTSFSAPYISGALALFKSAAPAIPMTVIRAILLTTATPLGSRITTGMPDELYGWGMVNVSAGIKHIEGLETAETGNLPGVNLQAFRSGLPDGFRHLSAEMKNISVAVAVTENSFVNIPLSDLLPQSANSAPAIGGAAGEMAAAGAEEKWRPGFAAFADSSRGAYKLSWTGGAGKTQIGGELLHYAEDETFTGMGALGGASGKQSGGKIRMKRGLFGGLSAFGEYEYAEIKAKAESGGLLSDIRGAEMEGWSAGMEFADMWRKGGRLILSAKQAKGLSGGEMIIRRPLAEGEFYDAFLGESEQRIVERESSLRLRSEKPLIWTAGYAMETETGGWSAAAEYAKGNTALSAQWKIDL
ncbi:MAG: S8 family peptidase [Gammaproteobacteria bacterium]